MTSTAESDPVSPATPRDDDLTTSETAVPVLQPELLLETFKNDLHLFEKLTRFVYRQARLAPNFGQRAECLAQLLSTGIVGRFAEIRSHLLRFRTLPQIGGGLGLDKFSLVRTLVLSVSGPQQQQRDFPALRKRIEEHQVKVLIDFVPDKPLYWGGEDDLLKEKEFWESVKNAPGRVI